MLNKAPSGTSACFLPPAPVIKHLVSHKCSTRFFVPVRKCFLCTAINGGQKYYMRFFGFKASQLQRQFFMDNLILRFCIPQSQPNNRKRIPENPFKIFGSCALKTWEQEHTCDRWPNLCTLPRPIPGQHVSHDFQNVGVIHNLQQRLVCPSVRGRNPLWTWNKAGKTIGGHH